MCLRTHRGLQHQVIHSPSALGFEQQPVQVGHRTDTHRAAQQCLILCVDPDIRVFTVCIQLLPSLKSSAKPNQLTAHQPDGHIKLCLSAFLHCLGRFDLVALTNPTNCLGSTSRHSFTQVQRLSGQHDASA